MLILADFAQVADGKLTVVGAGWDKIGPKPSPSGIGLLLKVPWEETNQRHKVDLSLVDSDGGPVLDAKGPLSRCRAISKWAVPLGWLPVPSKMSALP